MGFKILPSKLQRCGESSKTYFETSYKFRLGLIAFQVIQLLPATKTPINRQVFQSIR